MALEYKRLYPFMNLFSPEAFELPQPTLADEAVRKGLRELKTFLQALGAERPARNIPEAQESFARGEAWALVDQTIYFRSIRRKADFDIDLAPLPVPATTVWCFGAGIKAGSIGKPGIRELFAFLKAPHTQELVGGEGDFVPAIRSVAEKMCARAESDGQHSFGFLPRVIESGVIPSRRARETLDLISSSALDVWDLL